MYEEEKALQRDSYDSKSFDLKTKTNIRLFHNTLYYSLNSDMF